MKQKPERTKSVAFIEPDLKTAFEELKKGKYEEQCLAMFLGKAIDDLKENPLCGIKFLQSYGQENTFKSIALTICANTICQTPGEFFIL